MMVTFYSSIVKLILMLNLSFSRPQINHIVHMMHGIILCEGRKNISQIRNKTTQYRDLSCMTRFLKESPWNVNHLQKRRMQFLMKTIQKSRQGKGDTRSIVFLIVDDTKCIKDKSTKHIEGLDFHFSHEDGKSSWSHSLVTTHVVSEGYSFAWDFRPYFREEYCSKHGMEFKSKNDLAVEMIQEYSSSRDEVVYVLVDSWYTSKQLMDVCNAKGFHIVAAVKANRTICPAGIRIKISEFASNYIQKSDLRSVTVENQGLYWVYQYEGPLAEIENVKVLLSWENEFSSSKTPFCILCTDHSLDLVTILRYYQVRWNVETGYRFFKEMLGFDQYQLLSYKAIQRFWAIQFLTYNFLEIQRKEWSSERFPLTLGDVVRRIRNDYIGQMVIYIYEQALVQKPIVDILKALKLTA
jgi:hypothetical protein